MQLGHLEGRVIFDRDSGQLVLVRRVSGCGISMSCFEWH